MKTLKKALTLLLTILTLLMSAVTAGAVNTQGVTLSLQRGVFAKAGKDMTYSIDAYFSDNKAVSGTCMLSLDLPQIFTVKAVYFGSTRLEEDDYYHIDNNNLKIFNDFAIADGGSLKWHVTLSVSSDADEALYPVTVQSKTSFCDMDYNRMTVTAENGLVRVVNRDSFKMGDINSDSEVNTLDLTTLRKFFIGAAAESFDAFAADIHADGAADIRDLVAFKKQLAGLTHKNDVYLSENGSDKGSGTSDDPVRSFNRALSLAADGGIVHIAGIFRLETGFVWNYNAKEVTVEGGEIDAKALDSFIIGSDVTFCNITLRFNDNQVIGYGGNNVVIGENVSIVGGINYMFNGSVDFDILNNYLDKAVQYYITSGTGSTFDSQYTDEAIRFITNIGAKYVMRAAGEWYPSYDYEINYPTIKGKLAAAHKIDQDIIFEASIFEVSSPGMNQIPIPEWVFQAFGQTPEKRNFDISRTVFSDGYGVNYWDTNHHIPDITTTEMQMFVYYRACSFIDLGFEALHLGQVELTGKNDTDNTVYTKLIGMIRDYAKTHARRGYVIINAHHDMDFLNSDNGAMLVDMIVAPSRVHAEDGSVAHATTYDNPQRCQIDPEYWSGNVIYNHNPSGTSPSGWYAEKYPYLVQFDNYGDILGDSTDPEIYVWGKDEAAWYKEQPAWYRKEFLDYLKTTIDGYNENGHIAYFAYSKKWGVDPEVYPDNGDEEILKEIFSK